MADPMFQEKFLDILEKNIGMIIKISKAYTTILQDREDLINDIILELWKSFKKFKNDSKISTWIYRVALNTSLNYRRKRRNNRLYLVNEMKPINDQSNIFEQVVSPQFDILYECINELSPLNKALILLYLDGNSYDEISKITGITKTNVGTRISRIKDQLRDLTISKS